MRTDLRSRILHPDQTSRRMFCTLYGHFCSLGRAQNTSQGFEFPEAGGHTWHVSTGCDVKPAKPTSAPQTEIRRQPLACVSMYPAVSAAGSEGLWVLCDALMHRLCLDRLMEQRRGVKLMESLTGQQALCRSTVYTQECACQMDGAC